MNRAKGDALARTFSQQAHALDILRETRSLLRVHAISYREKNDPVPPEILSRARLRIQEALTEYAHTYSVIANTRCRLCVKMIRTRSGNEHEDPSIDDFFIYTLARDADSASENRKHDEKRRDNFLDQLKDNSDFLELWSQDIEDEGIFFSGDLRSEKEYETSSLNYRRNILGNPNTKPEEGWPLWYTSTIVWPIRQEKDEDLGIMHEAHHGFLTVDSQVPHAFDRDIDVPLGRILANALLPVLDLYTELLP